MNETHSETMRAVVVHRGSRDAYQAAAALAEAGLLECLVTDLYWPNDRTWAFRLASTLKASLRHMLSARYNALLPSKLVVQNPFTGMISHLADKVPGTPFAIQQRATRWTDKVLGEIAGMRARSTHSTLLSYSYYGTPAFAAYGGPGMLFQAHPHPLSVRRILRRELEMHPECAVSLKKEWELSLPPEDFERLVLETRMAAHTIVASTFTRKTLVENGTPEDTVSVVPYGVDLQLFNPMGSEFKRSLSGPLKLLFVGRINQRKGIRYLLEALRATHSKHVKLLVCGRVVDDLSLFKSFESQVTIRPSVSGGELVDAYRAADLFVFPSVVEGFGHVLLESLACGLPVLSTTSTAAPDLITDGIEGFAVEPCRSDLLADKIEWALTHRKGLMEMRVRAREKASHFTWELFRRGIVDSVLAFQNSRSAAPEVNAQYV